MEKKNKIDVHTPPTFSNPIQPYIEQRSMNDACNSSINSVRWSKTINYLWNIAISKFNSRIASFNSIKKKKTLCINIVSHRIIRVIEASIQMPNEHWVYLPHSISSYCFIAPLPVPVPMHHASWFESLDLPKLLMIRIDKCVQWRKSVNFISKFHREIREHL